MGGEHATLFERLAWRARTEPERVALHFRETGHPWGELWRRVERFAAALMERGLGLGDRAVLAVPNGPEFFIAFYGIQRAGGVPVPLSPDSGPERLTAMAERCGARTIVASAAARPAGESVGGPLEAAGLELVDPTASPSGALPRTFPEPHPDHLAYIQYTSGTTGAPKGVEIRHDALLENIHQMIAGMEITESDVFVSWLPVHHDMGLVLMTMVPLYLGRPLFLLPTSLRHPATWLAAIRAHRGTFTAAPDFAYRVCLHRIRDPAAHDLSSLRVALNAAEPVRRDTLTDFEATFGLRHVMMPAYGLAEATVGVSMCALGRPVRVDARGFVSVGRPFPEIELAILADGRSAAPGEVGEIVVKSPANTRGYWDDARATRALLLDDGSIRTGDLGYLDDDGELFVVGRRKNLIIQGGRNIAPREVEEALDPLPFVRASAAVGIDRGGDAGEQVYAFIELRGKARRANAEHRGMAARAVDAVWSHLGLRPARVYLMPGRAIPRTSNGKIRYTELRRRYLDGRLRAEGRLLFPDY